MDTLIKQELKVVRLERMAPTIYGQEGSIEAVLTGTGLRIEVEDAPESWRFGDLVNVTLGHKEAP